MAITLNTVRLVKEATFGRLIFGDAGPRNASNQW